MPARHLVLSGLFIALAALGGGAQERQQDTDPRSPRPVVGRSMVATTFGIVAASQPLAARAGVQILERGGNAIDAAIAANATIGLMEPTGNGIGGDLFILYYEAKTGTLHGLNSSGWAPTGLTVDFLTAKGLKTMPQRGIYSVTVPGVVAGWDAQPLRHQDVLRAAGAGDLLRRERVSVVRAHRGVLGRLGQDAQRASELAKDVLDRWDAGAACRRSLSQSGSGGLAPTHRGQ